MLLQLHVAAYWSVLLHTSKIVNYGSDSFEIQYGDGLWPLQNIRGVLPQKCSILLHTVAQCCNQLRSLHIMKLSEKSFKMIDV